MILLEDHKFTDLKNSNDLQEVILNYLQKNTHQKLTLKNSEKRLLMQKEKVLNSEVKGIPLNS
jgi:RNA polymerase-interacting CarD/CdnL/TRCF family regulator